MNERTGEQTTPPRRARGRGRGRGRSRGWSARQRPRRRRCDAREGRKRRQRRASFFEIVTQLVVGKSREARDGDGAHVTAPPTLLFMRGVELGGYFGGECVHLVAGCLSSVPNHPTQRHTHTLTHITRHTHTSHTHHTHTRHTSHTHASHVTHARTRVTVIRVSPLKNARLVSFQTSQHRRLRLTVAYTTCDDATSVTSP